MARNGKAINEYLHQAAPASPVVHFSDRPLKIAGIKITPKWAWSDGYRKWVRAQHRNIVGGLTGLQVDRKYRDWLRCEHMPNLTPDEATQLINNQRQAA